MSPKLRRALLLFTGLLILLVALFALAYALWPLANAQTQLPLEPTLFAPPAP